MRQRENWEELLQAAMRDAAGQISAPGELRERISAEIEELSGNPRDDGIVAQNLGHAPKGAEMEVRMKKFTVRKAILIAAAACLVVGSGAFAAGRIAGYSSGTRKDEPYGFAQLDGLEQQAGYQVQAVESFENGYKFEAAYLGEDQATDTEGNVVMEGKTLDMMYAKGGEPSLSLMTTQVFQPGEEQIRDKTANYGGIEVVYSELQNKFVPPDYELTDEDKAKMDDPHFNLAYGTEKVEYNRYSQASWIKDGVKYSLGGMDLNLSGEELMAMAGEVIEGGK